MTARRSFSPALFAFLRDLEQNNNRGWFNANKARYISDVRDPMLDFIERFAPRLAEISGCFVADPRANGGSLFRIHRDVRFARDKRPYKTNAGAHFRHQAGRSAHAPGFYLHLEPGGGFAASGVWRPDGPALAKIRNAIAGDPARWRKVTSRKALGPRGALSGQSLKRPPRGWDPGHPLIEDLKRKDFFALARFSEAEVRAPGFMDEFAKTCRAFSALTRFLTEALEHPW
jgi:uncharacterized protein (TIGR02453 family)